MSKYKPSILRDIFSVVCGIAAAVGVILLDRLIINSLVSSIESHDLRAVIRIYLWLISIVITAFIGIVVGLFVGKIINILLGGKP